MTVAGLAATPFLLAHSAGGQAQTQPLARPVVVNLRASTLFPELIATLLQGFHDVGLENGRDFDLVNRLTENDPSRLAALVAELVALNPSVVIVPTTPLAVEMAQATKTIPIVATTISDPIGLGLAQSIAHPGGNFTGVLSTSASTAKQVEVLREIVPDASRIGALINPSNTAHVRSKPKVEADLTSLSITVVFVEARVAADIPGAFQALREANVQAMWAGQDPLFNQEAKTIADLALAAHLPLSYGFRIMVEAGGLVSYGTSLADHYRRAGVLAGKIVKGEKPGDLAIEQNAKVELVINVRTAKALGLTIPTNVMVRADEVIE